MTDDLIPDDLREFILEYFDSIAELEALLLLRNDGRESWSPAMVARRLYVDEAQVSAILRRQRAQGFLVSGDSKYNFECADETKRAMIDRLAAVYARHIVPVTNIIHNKPPRIVKFADAFRLKKDKGD